MIKGISKSDVYPYIPVDDRVSENPTTFMIRPKTGHDNNVAVTRYATAKIEKRRGNTTLDPIKMTDADIEDFSSVVIEVKNYVFSEDSPYHENGKIYEVISSPEMIKSLGRELPSEILSEILEASNSISLLSEGTKKKSN